MCWYTATTLAVEVLYVIVQPTARDRIPTVVGRVLTYGAMASFIVFARACGQLRRYEATRASSPKA